MLNLPTNFNLSDLKKVTEDLETIDFTQEQYNKYRGLLEWQGPPYDNKPIYFMGKICTIINTPSEK